MMRACVVFMPIDIRADDVMRRSMERAPSSPSLVLDAAGETETRPSVAGAFKNAATAGIIKSGMTSLAVEHEATVRR